MVAEERTMEEEAKLHVDEERMNVSEKTRSTLCNMTL
jgi:hypothetical protein